MRIRTLDNWVFFGHARLAIRMKSQMGYEMDNDYLEDTEVSDSGD